MMSDKIKVFQIEGAINPDFEHLVCETLQSLIEVLELELEPHCEAGDKFGRLYPVDADVGTIWSFKVSIVEMTREELDELPSP
jgi:hypothetical protein